MEYPLKVTTRCAAIATAPASNDMKMVLDASHVWAGRGVAAAGDRPEGAADPAPPPALRLLCQDIMLAAGKGNTAGAKTLAKQLVRVREQLLPRGLQATRSAGLPGAFSYTIL